MGSLLVVLAPVALLWIGMGLLRGRAMSPEAVLRSLTRSAWKTLKWLWREQHQRGGAGRLRRPPFRYRR
jgi:hypothetical protein